MCLHAICFYAQLFRLNVMPGWQLGAILMPRAKPDVTAKQLCKVLNGVFPDGPPESVYRATDCDKVTEILEELLIDVLSSTVNCAAGLMAEAARLAWGLEQGQSQSFSSKWALALGHCKLKAKSMQTGKKLAPSTARVVGHLKTLAAGVGSHLVSRGKELLQVKLPTNNSEGASSSVLIGGSSSRSSEKKRRRESDEPLDSEPQSQSQSASSRQPPTPAPAPALLRKASVPALPSALKFSPSSRPAPPGSPKGKKAVFAAFGLAASPSPLPTPKPVKRKWLSPVDLLSSDDEPDEGPRPRLRAGMVSTGSEAASSSKPATPSAPYWNPVTRKLCRPGPSGVQVALSVTAGLDGFVQGRFEGSDELVCSEVPILVLDHKEVIKKPAARPKPKKKVVEEDEEEAEDSEQGQEEQEEEEGEEVAEEGLEEGSEQVAGDGRPEVEFEGPEVQAPVLEAAEEILQWNPMYYKNSGAAAVRERGGKQIFQFKARAGRGSRDEMWNIALAGIEKLKQGEAKPLVRAWCEAEAQNL